VSREADRQELPALMRRDVRLLGDLLGEVIRACRTPAEPGPGSPMWAGRMI
jgi:hypothetical protein